MTVAQVPECGAEPSIGGRCSPASECAAATYRFHLR